MTTMTRRPTTPTTSTTPTWRSSGSTRRTRRALVARRARVARLAGAALVALLLVACGGPDDPDPTPAVQPNANEPAPAPEPTPDREPDTEPDQELGADPDPAPGVVPAAVARTAGDVEVFAAPRAAAPTRTLPATTDFGSPRALLVTTIGEGADVGWVEVLLPTRPNGTTGWIRADAVDLEPIALAVTIDLDDRELTVRDGDEVVLSTPTAIGDADHPTPTGTFYVTDKLDTGDPHGPYGPYALGLSAWSDVLTEFAGGDGQVGIHGTNAPDSIGRAASHGCLRVPNDVIEQLAHLLPLGTPVVIS